MSRRSAREAAMKLLYEYSITGELKKDSIHDAPDVLHADELDNENHQYIDFVIQEFLGKQAEIDALIEKYSLSWKFDRISKVDLAIIRLAIFEIEYVDAVPAKVAVNEAVELAKKYSSDKSYKFINGLLGGYMKGESGK